MRKLLLFMILLASAVNADAKQQKRGKSSTCEHKNLSTNFDYKTYVSWTLDEYKTLIPDGLVVIVTKKDDASNVQTIAVTKELLGMYYDTFSCKNVRSFFTGINADSPHVDYDWGNLVIRDFNFDGLEDFAVKVSDNNSGPSYEYYVQHNGKFEKDFFLTDSVSWMLDSFNTDTKQAFMMHNSGCCWAFDNTYKYDETNRSWILVERKERALEAE